MPTEYDLDFRERPACYKYQSGEQGVFKVQPYKGELLPLWKYKDKEAAETSSEAIWEKYEAYKKEEDFVGMDMARKFLQMGFTRAMRYAKYPGGRKYDTDGTEREPETWADEAKREAAVVFRKKWEAVRDDADYERLKERHTSDVYDPDCGVM